MSKEQERQLRSIKDQQLAKLIQRFDTIPPSRETPHHQTVQAFQTYAYVNEGRGTARKWEVQIGKKQVQQVKSGILYQYNQFLYEQAMAELRLQQFILNATQSIECQKQLEIKHRIQQHQYIHSHSTGEQNTEMAKCGVKLEQVRIQEPQQRVTSNINKPTLQICSLEINTGHQELQNNRIKTIRGMPSSPETTDPPFKNIQSQQNSIKHIQNPGNRGLHKSNIDSNDHSNQKRNKLYSTYLQITRSNQLRWDAHQKLEMMQRIKKFWKEAKSSSVK